MKDKAEVRLRIAELSNTAPGRIPDQSRFLLEIDTEQLMAGDFNTQVYWVTAMEAARRAPAEALFWGNIRLTPVRSTFVGKLERCLGSSRVGTNGRNRVAHHTAASRTAM